MATISQTRPTANETHSRTSSIASEAFDVPPTTTTTTSSNVVVDPIKSPKNKNSNNSNSSSSNSPLHIITNINKLIMAQQDKRHQLVTNNNNNNHQNHIQGACVAKSATGGITLAFPILPSSSSSAAQPVATVVSSHSSSASASGSSLNSATTASDNRGRHFSSPQPNASYATMTLANTHQANGGIMTATTTSTGGGGTSSMMSIPGSAATTASASSSLTSAISQQLFQPQQQQAQQALLAAAAGLAQVTPLTPDILTSANNTNTIMNMNSVANNGVVNIANTNPLLVNTTLNNNSNNSRTSNNNTIIQTNPLLALNCTNGSVVNAYTTAATAAALLPGGSVPEFLYQLTKMLTDNTNREIIEWSTYSGNGRIEVHHPGRLEKEILGRYFRHSKYSSFQRQLNYFGFRKIAGKGKMSPCSYVNENATMDIRSLLLMKRKNSKEKEKELLAQQLLKQQQEQQQNGLNGNGTGAATAATAAAALLNGHNKRRPNPGDDIQPATIQPMFTTSINNANLTSNNNTNQMFTAALAANIVRAIPASAAVAAAPLATTSIPINLQGNQNGANKRPRLNQDTTITTPAKASSSTTTPSDGRGYTVAIGKGVRHQLNGYLRATSNGPIAPSTVSSTTSSSAASNAPSYQTYLSHPAAKLASSAPAPLQFLDPSELGMSIESSLSQLKNAFAAASSVPPETSSSTTPTAAAGCAAGAAGTASATTDGSTSSTTAPSSTDANAGQNAPQVKYAASPLTRRVASNTFIGGMLSRDDSLINLAMLPTLDNADASTSTDATSGGGGDNQNDYMKSIFSRESSLMNLAAAGDATNVDGKTGQEKEGGADTFDFIDFQT